MNIQQPMNRRFFLHTATLGTVMFAGATLPGIRSVFAQAGTDDTHFICQYDNVNLRDDYGLSSNVIGVLNTGDAVTMTGDSAGADGYTWIPITVDATGESGWAAYEYFSSDGGGGGWPAGTLVHVSSDNVNLRSGPGLGYDVIGNYNTGIDATVVAGPEDADGYSWYQIEVQGNTGWMDAEFLAEGSGGGDGWQPGTEVHVTSNDVNLRDEPGLASRVILTMEYGSTWLVVDGPVNADGYTWYEIKVPEGAGLGWAAADFLAEGPGDGGGGDGWAPGTEVMTTSDLNLRSGPGTSYGIIATYGGNERATVVDGPTSAEGYAWYQVEVQADGNVGWFASEFLEIASTEPTGDRLRVVDGLLNLRSEPGTESSVIAGLPTGTIVVILDSSFVEADGYIWMNVSLESNPETVGWIAQGFTEEI